MDEEADKRYFEFGRLSADVTGGGGGGMDEDDVPIMEWMIGLPSCDDLIPLTHRLVSPELASAFSIPLPGIQSIADVQRAAQKTISNLTRYQNKLSSSPPAASLKPFSADDNHAEETTTFQADDRKESSTLEKNALSSGHGEGSSGMMLTEALDGDSSSIHVENSMEDNSGRMLKRARLVWTPQLHKRFVDVVSYLGIKNAVPKTIMQLMNVGGLTRENVASHLQKYRLYLKRVQGLSNEGPSSTDLLFASTPVPQSLQEQQMPMPMPYTVPAMIPMSVYSFPHQLAHVPLNNHQGASLYSRFDSHHLDVPNECSGGNKFAPIFSYPHHVSPSGK